MYGDATAFFSFLHPIKSAKANTATGASEAKRDGGRIEKVLRSGFIV
jgi:hypothetical protein